MKHVAAELGNTAAVCRNCYIHPLIVDAFLDGTTVRTASANGHGRGLGAEERAVLGLLARSGGESRRRAS